MKRKLILFDIDGILTITVSSSYDYWHEVLKKHYGIDVSRNDLYMEGKTDREILKEFLELAGIKNSFSDKRFVETLNDIGVIFREAVRAETLKIVKLPNVGKLIGRLVEEEHVIGLLTGNTREKAEVKLQKCGLWKYFKVGAFGDVSDKRSELVSFVINDAKDKLGIEFLKEYVFVVGDTVRDIRCAKEAGVKSIAVATGNESFEILKQENPDFIFRDFKDIDKLIEVFE